MKSIPELLLVDDNPADLLLAREALTGSAHRSQISTVEDGVEAMAFLSRQEPFADAARPDLMILDLNLPKKDGRAVLSFVKSHPDLCRIPVVIFSTSRLAEDIARSYALGANCYVSKPGTLDEFFLAVQSIEQYWFGFATLPPRGE